MKYAFLVILVSLLVASCAPAPQEGDNRDPLQGTEGVRISLLNPPGVVYENEEFPVMIHLQNMGAYNVSPENPGSFYVSVDPLYLSRGDFVTRFHQAQNGFWLYGRTIYAPGEEAFITQYITANPILRQSSEVRTPITVTACYPYHTTLTQQVCIERNRFAEAGSVACVNRPVRPPSAGAPMGVSQIETRTTTSSDGSGVVTTFRITVKNLGSGTPAALGCSESEINQDLNAVVVSASLLGEPLECGFTTSDVPDRYQALVSLRQGEGTVTCRLPDEASFMQGESNFASLLSVDIDYSYRTSARHEVVIVR